LTASRPVSTSLSIGSVISLGNDGDARRSLACLQNTKNIFVALRHHDAGITGRRHAAARLIKKLSETRPQRRQFPLRRQCQRPHTRPFPGAYHTGPAGQFAIGLPPAGLLTVAQNAPDLAAAKRRLSTLSSTPPSMSKTRLFVLDREQGWIYMGSIFLPSSPGASIGTAIKPSPAALAPAAPCPPSASSLRLKDIGARRTATPA